MIPGEIIPAPGALELNEGRKTMVMHVANTGDRPIQVGSHYHFAEANPALSFDRDKVQGFRLNIASGSATRFEPGQARDVELIELAGRRIVTGFRGRLMDTGS